MTLLNFFFNNVLINLIIIIYDSLISFLIILIIILIFRIKDSNIKILFFFIPLLKPFIIIFEKLQFNQNYFFNRIGVLGLRIPSPSFFITRFEPLIKNPFNYSNINNIIIYAIIISIFVSLLFRWIILYSIYKNISYCNIDKKFLEISELVKKLSKFLKINEPKINILNIESMSPFVIGIRKSVLVISEKIINKLNMDEKEILILHELSHIKRKDNVLSWIALILKDLLFFNPIAHIVFYLIKCEQEKATDKLILLCTKKENKEIAKNILNIMITIKDMNKRSGLISNQVSNFAPIRYIKNKLLIQRINSVLNTKKNSINMNISLKILMYILFFIVLLIQIVVIVKIGNSYIFLR